MRIFKLSHTVILITLVTGCASFEKKSSADAVPQQVQISDTKLSERVDNAASQVEQHYVKAQNENYSFYAPSTWQSTQKDIVSMRKLVNEFDPNNQGFFGGPSEREVLASISEVGNALTQAQNTKDQVTTFLAKQLADIEYLTPKIDKVRQREFATINKKLNQLISMIEKEYTLSRQEAYRDKLQKRIHTLEIDIVTADYYSPLEEKFNQLNQQVIPQSYNSVLQELKQLDHTITTEPRNQNALEGAANVVDKNIQSAVHVTTDVNWINSLNKKQREQIVLNYRSTLEDLGLKFLDQDLSNLSYKAQVKTFEVALSAKLAEFEVKDTDVTTEKVELVESKPKNNITEIEAVKTDTVEVATIEASTVENNPVKNASTTTNIANASSEAVLVETTQVTTSTTVNNQ
ncbi:hypothetical protein HWV00_08225 [Moritella sp. 24]|uniref:hypothetical protein n=1 Tax=Moritella sp. 24 TaxID=2746230 RepID=UPI001BA8CD9F|nr:hypothetical protein [Moritella sp. 24]QUM76208.1 hypothetical protein HWV00_08225 [Moritella sp. 24]